VNPDDAFERCLEALYEAALDDVRWPAATALVEEAVGTGGNSMTVGEGHGDDVRHSYARFLERGESVEDRARVYFNDYHAHDEGLPRLRRLAERPVPEPTASPAPDRGEVKQKRQKAEVSWETMRKSAERISDDIAHDIITGWAERED